MDKTERYEFEKEEVYAIFEKKIGCKIRKIRFSPRQQTIICECGGKSQDD